MAKQYGRTHKNCKKGQETGMKEEKPTTKQRQALKKLRSQKMDHAIRSKGWVAGCADKPLGHDGRISSRQISDIHESEAHAKPKCHQPVPSQYKRWWGYGSEVRRHGLAVGRGENLLWGSCSNSFRGNILLGWHTTQRKQGWAGTTRCMPWRIGRERALTL